MYQRSWKVIGSIAMSAALVLGCGGAVDTGNEPAAELEQTEQSLLTIVTCVGSVSSSYSPALTSTPQTVSITGTASYSLCTGTGGVTTASNSTNAIRPDYSCLGLLEVGTSPATVTWNTGETSTMTTTRVSVQLSGISTTLLHVGSVTAGKFVGARVVRATEFLNTDLDACYTPEGLSQISGPSTLNIVSLL